jgi:hypothetical protein
MLSKISNFKMYFGFKIHIYLIIIRLSEMILDKKIDGTLD